MPVRTNRFVGREQYLKDIELAFASENKKIIVLSSFPGTGKTTLANEFGYRFTEKSINKKKSVFNKFSRNIPWVKLFIAVLLY